jgi:dihydrofolate reductase
LVLVEFVTLDGVMQGFGSPDEDRDGGFEHGGWGNQYMDGSQADSSVEGLNSTTAYLFGRGTYEKMIQFWPHQSDANPMAAHLNASPKFVVTSTLSDDDLTWNNTHVLDGDVDEAVRSLKAANGGNVVVLGSWTLTEHLIRNDHVDEYRIFLHPLVMGIGKRLFRPLPSPQYLRLVDASPTSTGVLRLRYARA